MAIDLDRFVEAQDSVYERALGELHAGAKRSHWIWFIFPQLRGLGHSAMAWKFGIESRAEAKVYLAHPVLGPRLIACTEAVNAVHARSAHQIFGSPDDLKFRSCLTLFAAVPGASSVFAIALTKFFEGMPDPVTIQKLREQDAV